MVQNVKKATTPRVRVLLSIQGGGFFWQSRSVAKSLSGDFDLHYISPDSARPFEQSGLPQAPWHTVSNLTTLADRSAWRKTRNILVSLRETLAVVRAGKPEAIVCVATSLAVPLFIWGRIFGKRTVFIESITRVSTPSTTGRILSRLRLCDRFYVQWPEAAALYPDAICRGTVL
jgi:hypothetical protein